MFASCRHADAAESGARGQRQYRHYLDTLQHQEARHQAVSGLAEADAWLSRGASPASGAMLSSLGSVGSAELREHVRGTHCLQMKFSGAADASQAWGRTLCIKAVTHPAGAAGVMRLAMTTSMYHALSPTGVNPPKLQHSQHGACKRADCSQLRGSLCAAASHGRRALGGRGHGPGPDCCGC